MSTEVNEEIVTLEATVNDYMQAQDSLKRILLTSDDKRLAILIHGCKYFPAHINAMLESLDAIRALTPHEPEWHDRVKKALYKDQLVEAIKTVRINTGWSLKQSKEYIDDYRVRAGPNFTLSLPSTDDYY